MISTFFDNIDWDGRLYINGWAGAGATAPVVSPASAEILGHYGVATPDDVAAAVDIARAAQRDWAVRPADERATILRRAGDLLVERA